MGLTKNDEHYYMIGTFWKADRKLQMKATGSAAPLIGIHPHLSHN